MNNRAFSLIEVMVATAITLVLMLMVFNYYSVTRAIYSSGMAEQMLQDGTNTALSKIIQGETEYQVVGGNQVAVDAFRLSQAQEYCIGAGANCVNASTAELHFWGTDGLERWYSLGNGNTQLIYHHPTTNWPAMIDEVIYTAPPGATLTLRFWIPNVANYPSAVVGMDVALTQSVLGRTVNGSSTTIVNIRNHP